MSTSQKTRPMTNFEFYKGDKTTCLAAWNKYISTYERDYDSPTQFSSWLFMTYREDRKVEWTNLEHYGSYCLHDVLFEFNRWKGVEWDYKHPDMDGFSEWLNMKYEERE